MEGNGIDQSKVDQTKVDQANAFIDQMAIMNQIVREMKEIPVLPSEIPSDQSALTKVEFPEEGGMLTYMDGHEYPYRGFPYFEIVEKIDFIKKVTRASLSGLYHSLKKRNKFLLITLLPAIWAFKDFISTGIYTFYRIIERFRIKPVRYSRCVRELYRVFTIPRSEDEHTQELRLMLRDLLCMVLEFDNAYRFRAQDVIENLNNQKMKRHPLKELRRLFDILISRETTQEIRDTWRLAKMGIDGYLRFDHKFSHMLGDVLSEINIDQFKLTAEDKHYCEKRKDYNFAHLCQ